MYLIIHRILSLRFLFFFFFQAEDGIRDYKVTGVKTCALPIFKITDIYYLQVQQAVQPKDTSASVLVVGKFCPKRCLLLCLRSEERRVGKECSSGMVSEL